MNKNFHLFLSQVFIAALLGSSMVLASPVAYTVRDLGSLGGSYGIPVSINNSGQVVGDSLTSGDFSVRATLFGSTPSGNLDMGAIGGINSHTTGINSQGRITGYAQTSLGENRAVLFNIAGGSSADLGTLGGTSSFATGINDNGTVVGYSRLANGETRATLFSTSGGVNMNLGTLGGNQSHALAINNEGQIIGDSSTASGVHATMFGMNGINIDLGTLGGSMSSARAINDVGQVVGRAMLPGDSVEHAVLFGMSGAANIDLGTLGGTHSFANAINNAGQVVGYDAGRNDAFIWQSGVMMSLDLLIDTASEWDLIYALDINDRGQIAAYGFDRRTGAIHGLLLSANENGQISEPSSGALFAIALILVVATRSTASITRRRLS